MSFSRILSCWAPVVAFMGLLYFLSSRSDLVPSIPSGWDKVLHAGAYGVLAGLSLRAFHGGLGRLARLPTVLALLLTIAYGMLDEIHQSHVVGRDASVLDWLADVAGSLHGATFDLRTGAATGLPATKPLRTFPVRTRDGRIQVAVPPPPR